MQLCLRDDSFVFQILDYEIYSRACRRSEVDVCGKTGRIILNLLSHQIYIVDTSRVPNLEIDWPPDTTRDEARSPVPTILIRSFACVWTRLLSLIIPSGKLVLHLLHHR